MHARTLVVLALGVASAACGDEATPTPPARVVDVAPNVLVLTLDTTRADRLGCYGHAKAGTPNLDRLAASGARFSRAYAPVPLTLPSHAVLFSGKHPPELGVHDNGRTAVPPDVALLAEMFRERGARTGAFVSAQVLEPAFGLARGFDVYDCDVSAKDASGREAPAQRRGDATADRAIEWLRADDARPFFAWIHFYDPHSTYEPPSPWRERFTDDYDGEIAFMDAQIGRVLSALDARGALGRTIVVACADHGEGLGEHGEATHGLFVYDSTLRIPLIVSALDRRARVVDTPVGLVDVAPTLVELAGLSTRATFSGRSLAPALRGEALAERPVYGESEYGWLSFGWSPLHALVQGRFKYIGSSKPELFDVAADPNERADLAGTDAVALESMSSGLATFRSKLARRAGEDAKIDGELARKLESLGYVQSGTTASAPEDVAGLAHPLDMRAAYDEFTSGVGFAQHGFAEKGIPLLERAAAANPKGAVFQLQLGMAYYRASRWDDAARALDAAARLDPTLEQAQHFLGLVETERGALEASIRHFDLALALRPSAHQSLFGKCWALLKLGRADEAIVELRRLVELRPSDASYALNLAQVLRANDKPAESVAALRRYHEAHPDDDGFALYLAWELATNPLDAARDGKLAVAIAERAIAGEERAVADHLDTLAAAYAETGAFEKAVATIDEALAKGAGTSDAALLEEWRARRALYASRTPFRDR